MKASWSACLVLVGWVGCGSPIARPGPLEAIKDWTPPPPVSRIVDVSNDGLTVVGNVGQALSTATRIHQKLRALKIRNEVRCQVGRATARTRLHISFPGGLTDVQQKQVRQVIDHLQPAPS